MKYTLLFLFLLCTCALAAQSTKRAVTEIDKNDKYSFSVRVDRSQVTDLIDCYNLITGNELSAKSRGNFGWTDNDGAEFFLDTRKRSISIENVRNTAEAKVAAQRMAVRVKEHLNMEQTPATTPPPVPVN